MKKSTTILALLILISAFALTVGSSILPEWACFVILSICLISILVIVSIKICKSDVKYVDILDSIDKNLADYSSNLSADIKEDNQSILRQMASDCETVKEDVSKCESSISKSISKNSQIFNDKLDQQDFKFSSRFQSQLDEIKGIVDLLQIHSKHLQTLVSDNKDIISGNKSTLGKIVEETNSIISKINEHAENLSSSLSSFENHSSELQSTIAGDVKKHINESVNVIQESMNVASELLSAKTTSIAETIAPLGQSIEAAKTASNDSAEQLKKAFNERFDGLDIKVDSVAQKSDAIQESMNGASELLSARTTSIAETIAPLGQSIEAVKTASNDSAEQLKKAFSERFEGLDIKVDSVAQKSDTINESVSRTHEQIKSVESEHFNSIQQAINNIGQFNSGIGEKIDSIIANGTKISDMIAEDNKDYDRIAESFINDVKDHYNTVTNEISDIKTKTGTIEKSVNQLIEQSKNSDTIKSINTLIDGLSQDLKSLASDINKRILDSQVAQQNAAKDEIAKLQVLLRALLKTEDDKSSSSASKAEIAQSPNRTESISDPETHNLVINEYKNGQLSKSTMRSKRGIIVYEIEYTDGKISHTRNYNEKGSLTIEQYYYNNGQVHYRNEYRKSGKISTEFDSNGNII